MTDRAPLACAGRVTVAVVLATAVVTLFQHGLIGSDESREAGIGAEMLRSGLTAVPTLGGVPFIEKPPLHPWLMALGFQSFGLSPGVARLPAVLGGLLAAAAACGMGRALCGRYAGLFAALVLVSLREFSGATHKAVNDALLIGFVACGHLAVLVGRRQVLEGRRPLAFLALVPAAGLAFLTKNLIGPVLIAGPATVALLFDLGSARATVPRVLFWTGVGTALFGLPWIAAVHSELGADAVHTVLVDNTIGRARGASSGVDFHTHDQHWWFYLRSFPTALLPWSLALPALLTARLLRRRAGQSGSRHDGAWFLAVLVAAGVVLLSLPSGKRDVYAAPLLPAAAAVFGAWLARTTVSESPLASQRLERVTFRGLATVGAVVGGTAAVAALWSAWAGRTPIGGLHLANSDAAFGVGLGAQIALVAALVLASCWRSDTTRTTVAWRVAVGLALLTVAAHLTVRPFREPSHDGLPAMRSVLARVPPDESLIAVDADEQLRGLASFAGKRFLHSVDRLPDAVRLFNSGAGRHLIVREPRAQRLLESDAAHFVVVTRVDFPDDDPVVVLVYRP